MNKPIMRLYLIVFTITAVIFFQVPSLANRPLTIPALKEWHDSTGFFLYGANARIVLDGKYKDLLLNDSRTLREDLKALKGFQHYIINADRPKKGDIFLTLSATDSILGDQGYRMTISDFVHINARSLDGFFNGTRTLLQLLHVGDSLPRGFARDWPDYPERGTMVDLGRKYYSIDWLEKHIRELSYLKMNHLHFHITENEGFRLECKRYPHFTSEQFYKNSEIRSLQDFAAKYHITIVPEIEMPGHVWSIVKYSLPEMILKDTLGRHYCAWFDVTKDTVRTVVRNLLDEFIPLFSGPYWHMGGDEWIMDNLEAYPQLKEFARKRYGEKATPGDAFLDFVNWVDTIVNSYGKTLRVFNDGISKFSRKGNAVTVNKDVIIEYWLGDDHPQDFIDSGYKITNCSIDFLYYTLGSGWIGYGNWLYEQWKGNIYQGGRPITDKHPLNLGGKLLIWSDLGNLETEEHVAIGIKNALRVISDRLWGSEKLVAKYEDFEKIIDSLGIAPGVVFPRNPMAGNLAFGRTVDASSISPAGNAGFQLATDGNYNTSWSSAMHDSDWICVDLGKLYDLSKIKLVWFHTCPDKWDVQASVDSLHWTTIRSVDTISWRIVEFENLTVAGRYLRVLMKSQKNPNGCKLWEIEAYGNEKVVSDLSNSGDDSELLECYPNPFSSEAVIHYCINEQAQVHIEILDIAGRKLTDLVNTFHLPGSYQVKLASQGLAPGEYYCRITAGGKTALKKIILIK